MPLAEADLSPAQRLALLPPADQAAALSGLTDEELEALAADWRFWGRPKQQEPDGAWFVWGLLGGRGSGKTLSGSEWTLKRVRQYPGWRLPGGVHRVHLVGRTAGDVRSIQIEGETGLAATCERHKVRFRHEPTRRRVVFPDYAAEGLTFSAEEPDQLRGPQAHTGWAEEASAWRHIVDSHGNTAWSNLLLGLRLPGCDPDGPRLIVTATPKYVPLIRSLRDDSRAGSGRVHLTTMSMYENAANLAPQFIAEVLARYKGTRLEAQEIGGILLDYVEGALWTPDLIDASRLVAVDESGLAQAVDWSMVPALRATTVGVDPGFSSKRTADECGIVVVGVDNRPVADRHAYVLEDVSHRGTPLQWATTVVDAARRWKAREVVVESNLGGEEHMAEIIHTVDPTVEVVGIHAGQAKQPRAEPVAVLYDQRKVHHVGHFPELEAEMTTYVPGEASPNRMDALVHAVRHLLPFIARRPSAPPTRAPRVAMGFDRSRVAGAGQAGQQQGGRRPATPSRPSRVAGSG